MQTRQTIVDEALRQASRVGMEGLSLGRLADRLQLTKSGLFAHFKSKEALQLETLEEAIERFKKQVLAPASRHTDAESRLRSVFDHYLTWIRGSPDDGGCLFVTMAQEYDDRPGAIRDRLVESQRGWRAYLSSLIEEGVRSNVFRKTAEPGQVVFEITGAALAFQQANKLLNERGARRMALAAFERIVTDLRA